MKNLKRISSLFLLALAACPAIGHAADSTAKTLQEVVADYIVKGSEALLTLIFGLMVLVFMYGLMKFMFKGASSDTARTEGRTLMFWGVIGIAVTVSVWSLVGILASTIGHTKTGIPQFDASKVSN